MPPGTEDLVVQQFRVMGERPSGFLIGAGLVSLWAASGVIKSLIEGFQAAYRVPRNRDFFHQSVVAMSLVLLSAIPLVCASLLIVFGGQVERIVLHWMKVDPFLTPFAWVWQSASRIARYILAFATTTSVTSTLYYFGPYRKQRWNCVWRGATLATFLWFFSTLGIRLVRAKPRPLQCHVRLDRRRHRAPRLDVHDRPGGSDWLRVQCHLRTCRADIASLTARSSTVPPVSGTICVSEMRHPRRALGSCAAHAAGIPMTLVSDAEAEALHSAIVRKEAWTLDSVRHLRADAEKRLKEGPWSVTTERPHGIAIDVHDYYSEAPYWWPQDGDPKAPFVRRDGQINPNRFVANKNALVSMSDAVFTLGTAAYLLDEPRYAQRAARDINTWFINPQTRMNPNLDFSQSIRNFNNGRGAGVIDGRVFIRTIQGMEFLAQTGNWDPKDQAVVKKWFQDYLRWLTSSENANSEKHTGDNHASWWTAQVAAIATFVEDEAQEKAGLQLLPRPHLSRARSRPTAAPRAKRRARAGLWYSAFNLEALATTCRIAQIQGIDLWTARGKGGATIATVDRVPSALPLRSQEVDQGPNRRVFQRRPLLPGLRRHGTEETRLHHPLPQSSNTPKAPGSASQTSWWAASKPPPTRPATSTRRPTRLVKHSFQCACADGRSALYWSLLK